MFSVQAVAYVVVHCLAGPCMYDNFEILLVQRSHARMKALTHGSFHSCLRALFQQGSYRRRADICMTPLRSAILRMSLLFFL
ncbi:hypothetical protein C8Q73DRAFT_709939 [Cubamyces lactineus]|nr:hypothetical protein C8Q73DRAFT_709939 [Cubamyces lactineus]